MKFVLGAAVQKAGELKVESNCATILSLAFNSSRQAMEKPVLSYLL
jgi:hypothetical protein